MTSPRIGRTVGHTNNIFFSDLDGTLIYSARRIAGVPEAELTAVEFDADGPMAWMTATAAETLVRLRQRAEFVPVTTRTKEQFYRTALPGGPTRFAVLANGGRILVEGAEDADWTARVEDRALWGFTAPDVLAGAVTTLVDGASWLRKIHVSQNVVSVVGHRDQPSPEPSFYAALQAIADDNGYTMYPHGPKTYLIPSHVTKEAAAAEIADRRFTETGVSPVTFAAGDHSMDGGMMLWADAAHQPAHGANIPGVPVTVNSGVRAGQEILAAAAAAFPETVTV